MKDSFDKYILTRHSQTPHNLKKTQIQTHTNTPSTTNLTYKKSSQYISFKFDERFIDREQINSQQVREVAMKQNLNQIGLIIVSPLNRCILTAKQLNIPGVPIIVEPLISSRINSAWSVGKSLRDKRLKYNNKDVDFSYCQNENIHWCIDLLMNDSQKFRLFYSEKYSQIPKPEKLILEYLKQGKSQSYASIINRALKFKQKLTSTYSQLCDPSKQILIISHSNVLKVLTADRIDQKGKARSKFDFQHIEFVRINESTLINQNILKKEQQIENSV